VTEDKESFYMSVRRFPVGPIVRLLCKFEVVGEERLPRDGGYILASNHLRWYDPIVLAVYIWTQIAFGAKIELFQKPVIGRIMKRIEQIPLQRQGGNRDEVLAELVKEARDTMDHGRVFGLFPEGTRSPDGRLYKFHPGVTKVAFETKRLILPVGVTYSRAGLKLVVRIVVGQPIHSAEYDSTRELTKAIREQIRECTGQALAEIDAKKYREQLRAAK